MKTIAIVGASLAGARAAERLRERGFEEEMIERRASWTEALEYARGHERS